MANLETTIQITKLMQEQNKLFSAQTKMMKGNLVIMQAMASAMAGMPVKDISDNFAKANEAIKDADKAINQAMSSTVNLDVASKKAADSNKILGLSFDNIAKSAMNVSIAMDGWNKFKGTLSFIKSGFSGILDTISTLAGALIDIGASIISAPFKMLGSLISSAGQGGGGEFRQAVEDVRKEFGQLATNEAQAVIKGFRGIQGNLAETGLSVRRVFGNMAERLKAITELATKMGPAFSSLQNSFKDPQQMERMAAYQKGLGLTDEGIQGLSTRAIATGKSFSELGREITNYAFKLGDAFNVNGKIVARATAAMMADYKNFGNVSVKSLTQAAIYTRKLGLETKELLGVIDKFDDFEDAATAAAMLSQSFGLNIDAIKMLKEQDPAKRFEMLRAEFVKTGRDINTLTRQERSLLATQTGLSDEALLKGFGKQALSYEKIEKEAAKAEKRQLSQAEAMDKLAMSIERMVKSGGGIEGFWDAFTKGIGRGIAMSKEFREMYRAIQRALNATFMAGMQVGRAIVQFWPGIKQVFAGVRDIFREIGSFTQKLKVKGFMENVAKEIRSFLKNPEAGPGALLKNLQEKFFNIFNTNNPAVKGIIEGAKDMFVMLSKVMAMGLKVAIQEVTKAFKGTSGIFRALRMGPESSEWKEAFGSAGKIKDGFMGFLGEILAPFIELWNDPQLISQFNYAFSDFLTEMWASIKTMFNKYIWPKITDFWNENWKYIVGGASAVIFGPAIVSMLLAGLIKGVAMLMGTFVTKAAPIVSEGFKSLFGGGATDIAKEIGNTKSVAKQAGSFDWKSAGAQVAVMMAAIVGISIALGTAYNIMDAAIGNMSLAQITKLTAVLIAGTVGLVPIAGALKILESVKISVSSLMSLGVAIIALSGVAVSMAGVYNIMDAALGGVNKNDITKVSDVISVMAKAFATAAGVITASGLLAAVVTAFGPAAPFAAAAITAGFVALSATVVAMVTESIGIVAIINKANIDNSFKQKAEAVGLVVNFYDIVAKSVMPMLTGSVLDSLSSLISGGNKIKEKLAPVTQFIKDIFGNFEDIINTIKTMEISPLQLEQTKIISEVMNAIVQVSKYMTPPPELLGNNENARANLGAATKYAEGMMLILSTNVRPMVDSFIAAASGMKGVDSGMVDNFSKIINSIMPLIKILIPTGDFINSFKTSIKEVKRGGHGFTDTDTAEVDVTKMGTALSGIGTALNKFLSDGLKDNGWINTLTNVISTLPTKLGPIGMKSGIKAFETLSGAISSMFNIVKIFDLVQKEYGLGGNATWTGTIEGATSLISNSEKILAIMNTGMPAIATEFNKLDKNFKDLKMGHIEIVASSLTGMIKSINDTKTNLATLLASPLDITATLGKVADKLGIKDKSEFTIKHNDININVQLNLKVDAEEFAKIMVKQEAFSGNAQIGKPGKQ